MTDVRDAGVKDEALDRHHRDAGPSTLRLVALDLDGTLLRSDGSISTRTRSALSAAEDAGLTILSVTARPPRRMREVARETGLRGFCICSNGALTYDLSTDSVVGQTRLSSEDCSALIGALRTAVPGVVFAVEAGLEYGSESGYRIPDEHADDRTGQSLPCGDALLLSRNGVTKLLIQHPDHPLDRLLQITRTHAGHSATVTHSGSDFVEVAAASVTKAAALAVYCAQHGIGADQVIGFGDMPNDLPMLRWAGLAVAVRNAHAEVIAAADDVTASNDDDGVARYLERLAGLSYRVRPRRGWRDPADAAQVGAPRDAG